SVCSGATSLWKGDYWAEKGSGTPPGPCVVFNEEKSGSGMGHVGLYLGDGTTVDARGSAAGVLRSDYGSRAWSHFAVPRGYEEELDADEAVVTAQSGSTVRLRRLASETAGTLRRVPLGERVTVLEWGGEFSRVLDAGGLSGWIMTRFLQSETGVRYDVSLEDATESERAALTAACPRVTVIAHA
ncbi:MAG: hypothetical protein PHY12_04900, partial [Eubacteriales bacterium]|nr:hypothetical protein [Eubacteriales bacterium]